MRPKLLEAKPLILQDNATCHKAGNVRAVFMVYNSEILKHPPYSPDLSSCDYDLFPEVKEPLRGITYDDLGDLLAAVNGVVRDINVRCLATDIRELPKRWGSTILSAGNYIEGMCLEIVSNNCSFHNNRIYYGRRTGASTFPLAMKLGCKSW